MTLAGHGVQVTVLINPRFSILLWHTRRPGFLWKPGLLVSLIPNLSSRLGQDVTDGAIGVADDVLLTQASGGVSACQDANGDGRGRANNNLKLVDDTRV